MRYFKQEDFNKCIEFLKETQRQLVAIWNGKYDQFFRILMKQDDAYG